MTIIPFTLDSDAVEDLEVSYNGFRFPPAIKSNASFQPVYDKSGRMMKYIKVELSISTYIFKGADDGGSQGLRYDDAENVLDTEGTTDSIMTSLRQRLLEPCQTLAFLYQGVGNIVLNDRSGGPKDVDNGPKPQLLTWRPLTNKMAYIEWKCTACFSPCANAESGVLPSQIAQFPYTVSFNINECGLTERIIDGEMEIPLTRMPTNTTKAGKSYPFDTKLMQKKIVETFPMLKQFTRKQRYSLSEDRKTLRFSITDTEIDSDEAYGVGCARESCTLSANAHLNDGGFRKWKVNMSGSITVAAGYPKSYAYAEIARLFNKFFTINAFKYKNTPQFQGTAHSQGDKPTEPSEPSTPFLTEMSFSDEIFGRKIGFSFSWMLFVRIEDLFLATGLFRPVRNNASEQNKAWDDWVTSLGLFQEEGGYQGLHFNDQDDIVVSLCQPLLQGAAGSTTPDPKVLPPTETDPNKTRDDKKRKPRNKWAAHESQFEIEAHNHTRTHKPLGREQPKTGRVDPAKPNQTDMSFVPATGGTKDNFHHKTQDTSYTLVYRGYAIRLEHPVPIPEVKSYGGQAVTKIGVDRIIPRKLGMGIDVTNGNSYAMHGLMWEQRYSLPSPPKNTIIDSDGHPDLYT